MPRGGPRPNSGRKKGSPNGRSAVAAAKLNAELLEENITPLQVMIMAMRHHLNGKDLDRASSIAKDAAPYMHPRMNAIEHSGVNGGPIETASTVKIDVAQLDADELAALKTVLSKVVKE